MGKLIDKERRDRARQDRSERKRRILGAALGTFIRMPYNEVTLESIGREAGVERGIASMLLRTKEELFLALMRRELEEWYAHLEVELAEAEGEGGVCWIVQVFAEGLADRPALTRLLSLLPTVLDMNIEATEVYRFQKWRREKLLSVGALLDGLMPPGPGGGDRFAFLAELLAGAMDPAANLRGSAAIDAYDPEFALYRIDLRSDLATTLQAILNG